MNLERINTLSPEPLDRRYLADAFARMPARWAAPVARTYRYNYANKGRKAANLAVLEVLESLAGFNFGVTWSDDELKAFAEARANECARVAGRLSDADLALRYMGEVALRYGIALPAGRNVTKTGMRARLCCPLWWRRQARKVSGRNVEGAAIRVGLVHRHAGLYASDETVTKRAGQKRRNRALLESIRAYNDEGQSFTLQELSDKGTSNQENRRNELMTRLCGFDEVAMIAGHAAEFYTLTAPSKYHARDSISGRENPKYEHYTPSETQKYLGGVWSRIRADLARRGIRIYGFRVCEPHHDGTPHWHMVMFMEPQHVETVRAVMRKHALKVDGDETGADKHRFQAEAIDRSKGSAAGYLAKYIAKNIDGFGVGEDWEAVGGKDDAKASARRVDAWASRWGIRQFQQIGGAPVSVWRELRRLDAETLDPGFLRGLVEAADLGGHYPEAVSLEKLNGWGRFVNMMGGGLVRRKDLPVRVMRQGALMIEGGEMATLTKYGEVAADKVRGLSVLLTGEEAVTRTRVWFFERSGEAAPPWSSVNNCTGGRNVGSSDGVESKSGFYRDRMETPLETGDFDRAGSGGDSDRQFLTVIPSWDALPAYMQRVRPGLIFDGKGLIWQGTENRL